MVYLYIVENYKLFSFGGIRDVREGVKKTPTFCGRLPVRKKSKNIKDVEHFEALKNTAIKSSCTPQPSPAPSFAVLVEIVNFRLHEIFIKKPTKIY